MSRIRASVIIPVRNGCRTLPQCLRSIFASSYKDFECIVVDDESSDHSADLAESIGVRVIRLDRRQGAATARNRGAEAAEGDILVFTDADVQIYADTLEKTVKVFAEEPDLAAVFGSYDNDPACVNFCSQYKNLFHHFIHQHGREDAGTFWSGFGAIRKTAFIGVAGFDPRCRMMEDIQLGYKLKAIGCRIRLNKSLVVKHLKNYSFLSLVKSDLFDRAVPWTMLMLRHGRMADDLNLKPRYKISAACSLLVVFCLVLAPLSIWFLAVIPFLMGAFLILNVDLSRFFLGARGARFAVKALALYFLYYLYSMVGFALGIVRYLGWRYFSRPG